VDEKEELMLPLGEVTDRRDQSSDVALLLFLDDRGGVLACG
jgi:hypothetical protein